MGIERNSTRLFLSMVICIAACIPGAAQTDSDRDGIPDVVEQQLLEMFRPTFFVSKTDCSGVPARIKPGQVKPEVQLEDGTIYGQVSPYPTGNQLVEIHYYALWSKDCGRMSHPLDVEHVSALVSTSDSAPKALYWYAGAHEKTVCDISSGAHAAAIRAEEHGPSVWSSFGKHALYLRSEMCGGGCGADSCSDSVELVRNGPVINIGEENTPANDSDWVQSKAWVLWDKMDSDFSSAVLARLAASSPDSVETLQGRSSVRGAIQGSDMVLDAAATGADRTGSALGTANDHTSSGLGTATRATGRSLKRAWDAVFHRKSGRDQQ